MNDKDRDRSGDGAGPVAHQDRHFLRRKFRSKFLLPVLIVVCPLTMYAHGDDGPRLRGLSLTLDVGVLRPDNGQANFYNGAAGNVNTLERILHSESFGPTIWTNLTDQDLIGSAVGSYRQITVAEYGDMYYRMAIQLGMGFRYDYEQSNWAWQARFDYAKLHATGMVLLNSGKDLSILTDRNRYVNCPAAGEEERIYVDLGLVRKFRLRNGMDMEFALGGNVNNTKVESSDINIAGVTYSILDVWGGQSPSSYSVPYEYINQGGIGYGGYASLRVGYTLPAGTAIWLGYTFSYNKVKLAGYEGFAPHHAITLHVALNNFSFFDD